MKISVNLVHMKGVSTEDYKIQDKNYLVPTDKENLQGIQKINKLISSANIKVYRLSREFVAINRYPQYCELEKTLHCSED